MHIVPNTVVNAAIKASNVLRYESIATYVGGANEADQKYSRNKMTLSHIRIWYEARDRFMQYKMWGLVEVEGTIVVLSVPTSVRGV